MGELAIRVAGLGKQYRLGAQRERYSTLRDQVRKWASAPLRTLLLRAKRGEKRPPFWALKGVSFEVNRGEVVGVIGRNGAGKSTLLKVLSRITEPTEGEADIYGRVGSLLEVGTGFHPELTGRENVYLNGAILGMRRGEIARKFDEIVSFAEVEKFIDTPVKHYSSGMYTRLAFAVAAHLEPEILVVDEVLAVGDAAFQKKCLGKMGDVAKGGRTVLFVSHNMAAIRSLCQRCILLNGGRVSHDVPAVDGVRAYMDEMTNEGSLASVVSIRRPAGVPLWVETIRVRGGGEEAAAISLGDELAFEVDFEADPPTRSPRLGFIVADSSGTQVMNSNNRYLPFTDPTESVDRGTIHCQLGRPPLIPGRYFVTFVLGDQSSDYHVVRDQVVFEVVAKDIWGTGQTPPPNAGAVWWPTTFGLLPGRAAAPR
jgi:lipopolysaccharide transport system ATP-binding protein